MIVKKRVNPLCVFLVTFASLFFTSSVLAQATLEEIIVTAQKREESLQDAPVAVSVLTGDQLERAGVVDPDSLAEMIPNVDVNSEANRDGLIITIRGVSGTDVRNGADPTTAFHVDGSYVPRLSGRAATVRCQCLFLRYGTRRSAKRSARHLVGPQQHLRRGKRDFEKAGIR
jgi:hypothetical protein